MTTNKRLRILLSLLTLLLTGLLCYSFLEKQAYGAYSDSDYCRVFPELVMEVGLQKAIDLEILRRDDEDDFFFLRMAK